MSNSVFENIRQRFTRASVSDGPRPDVGPAKRRVPFKVRAAETSAALSHVAIIGLGTIALQTRPDLITALMVPSGPKALPLETARAATAVASAKQTPIDTVRAAAPIANAARPAPQPTQAAQTPQRATVSAVSPPPKTIAAIASADRITQSNPVPPSESQLQALPLTVARGVVMPEARLVLAAAAPIATVQALPMSRRARDIIRDAGTLRVVKARERDVTALATANPSATSVAVTAVASKAMPATVAPPITKWASLTPEQRAEANAPVKKSTPYTVLVTWTDEQIATARAECSKLLKSVDIVTTEAEPVKEGACGAPAPVNVRSVGNPKVQLHPASMMTCPMAAALDKWMTAKVQPAATATFGSPVARLISASSYSCRNRYGSANTPLSEHALVNALDLAGFVLADGRTVRVKQDWGPVARDATKKPVANNEIPIPDSKPAPIKVAIALPAAPSKAGLSMLGGTSLAKKVNVKLDQKSGAADKASEKPEKLKSKEPDKAAATAHEAAQAKSAAAANEAKLAKEKAEKDLIVARRDFLHRVHDGACDVFGTVLGPEANDAHRDHFHLDMKSRRHRAYCQ